MAAAVLVAVVLAVADVGVVMGQSGARRMRRFLPLGAEDAACWVVAAALRLAPRADEEAVEGAVTAPPRPDAPGLTARAASHDACPTALSNPANVLAGACASISSCVRTHSARRHTACRCGRVAAEVEAVEAETEDERGACRVKRAFSLSACRTAERTAAGSCLSAAQCVRIHRTACVAVSPDVVVTAAAVVSEEKAVAGAAPVDEEHVDDASPCGEEAGALPCVLRVPAASARAMSVDQPPVGGGAVADESKVSVPATARAARLVYGAAAVAALGRRMTALWAGAAGADGESGGVLASRLVSLSFAETSQSRVVRSAMMAIVLRQQKIWGNKVKGTMPSANRKRKGRKASDACALLRLADVRGVQAGPRGSSRHQAEAT